MGQPRAPRRDARCHSLAIAPLRDTSLAQLELLSTRHNPRVPPGRHRWPPDPVSRVQVDRRDLVAGSLFAVSADSRTISRPIMEKAVGRSRTAATISISAAASRLPSDPGPARQPPTQRAVPPCCAQCQHLSRGDIPLNSSDVALGACCVTLSDCCIALEDERVSSLLSLLELPLEPLQVLGQNRECSWQRSRRC
jgi:hypothetical protein